MQGATRFPEALQPMAVFVEIWKAAGGPPPLRSIRLPGFLKDAFFSSPGKARIT